jgi:hypothetical protein
MVESAPSAAQDVRPWLAEQFDRLGRWFQGRFVLQVGPDDEVVESAQLLTGERVKDLLVDAYSRQDYAEFDLAAVHPDAQVHVEAMGTGLNRGLSIAASRLTRHYCAPLTPVALAGLAAGIAFDLSPSQCRMVIANGVPFRLVLGEPKQPAAVLAVVRGVDAPEGTPRVDTVVELRALVWQNLYAEHVERVFAQMAEVARIAPALMWTNAAEWVAMIHDAALEYLGADSAAPLVAESRELFDARSLPGLGASGNPLRDKLEWLRVEDGTGAHLVQTRHMCCLTYLLADRFGRLCQNCPYLSPEDRIALIRERHGVPMGTPGGEAEQRAIAQGLHRPSVAAMFKPAEGAD